MSQRPIHLGGGHESGLATVGYVAAAGLALLFVTALVNVAVFQYGRGVVRAAVDEGVRAGARSGGSVSTCEAASGDVLGSLLDGALGDEVNVTCAVTGGRVTAIADATFRGWLPVVPDWTMRIEGAALLGPS